MRRALLSATLLVTGLLTLPGCSRRKGPRDMPAARTVAEPGSPSGAEIDAAVVTLGAPVPAGSLRGERFRFRISIFHPQRPKPAMLRELRAQIRTADFALYQKDKAQNAGTVVDVQTPTLAQFPAPTTEDLEHMAHGLSQEDKRMLQSSQAVTALQFEGPSERALRDYPKALAITLALARRTQGYLWDDETRQVFNATSFARRMEGWKDGLPDVSEHVLQHAYRDGELLRIVSLGMVKFGLPDVVVSQVSLTSSDAMSALVNAVCQQVLERAALEETGRLRVDLDAIQQPAFRQRVTSHLKPNAKHVLDVDLAIATLAKGDADNRLMELAFPGPLDSLQERQNAALARLFSYGDEGATRAVHDEEMLAASARARKKLFAMRERYTKEPPFGETLQVKAPFPTPDGNTEWMWVEVMRWDGDTIHGVLNTNPSQIPSLRAGARVSVSAQELFDYVLERGDAGPEGNETGAILMRRQGKP
jgi:uncharacterized protein YegJ (DUF2314 family)/predicted small lipoprotein YifL